MKSRDRTVFFSERNGYVLPPDKYVLEDVPPIVLNAICSAFLSLCDSLNTPLLSDQGNLLCKRLWTHFFHNKLSVVEDNSFQAPSWHIENVLSSSKTPWYMKLDFIEAVVNISEDLGISKYEVNTFVDEVNNQFESLCFGYRIIKNRVIDIISKTEKQSIEGAMNNSKDEVKVSLQNAIDLHCKRPKPDYSGSIRNSITAVEALCRNITGKDNLGSSLKVLEKNGVQIHPQIKAALQNLYNYTNQDNTGIRHALMDATSSYVPSSKESLFMLVTCSAFVNYIQALRIVNS